MTKSNKQLPHREDWDPDEWGNIKHPTLSEQELLTKNWEHSAHMKAKWKSGSYKDRNTPEYHKKLKEALNDPEYRKKQRKWKLKKHQEDPEWRYKISKAGVASRKTKKYQKNYAKGIEKRNKQNKEWAKNVREAKYRDIVTPFGEFASSSFLTKATQHLSKAYTKRWGDKKGIDFYFNNRLMPHLYYYKDLGPGKPTYEKVYITPYGEYQYQQDAKADIEKNEPDNPKLKLVTWWNALTKIRPNDFRVEKQIRREWLLTRRIID
jgi:hypothetical protein